MDVIFLEFMVSRRISIVLKWICVRPETIVTDIRQITLRKLFVINEQSAVLQFFDLLMQGKWAFCIVHIKLEDLPGCANLTGSVGGHIECKVSTLFWNYNALQPSKFIFRLFLTFQRKFLPHIILFLGHGGDFIGYLFGG